MAAQTGLGLRHSFMPNGAHYENTPIQINRKFHLQKTDEKKSIDILSISAQNID